MKSAKVHFFKPGRLFNENRVRKAHRIGRMGKWGAVLPLKYAAWTLMLSD
jgi:hypothetical protein